MTYVLHLHDPQATRTDLTGGKGASLARLSNWGFAVPEGVVVTGHAYLDFLGDAADIAVLLDQPADPDQDAARKLADDIQALLRARPLPQGLRAQLVAALQSFPDDAPFSVRSSATLEDLASAAFAGQHETFLNCRGIDLILDRIKACWLSMWSHRAMAYREKQGFHHLDAAMAVVVQRMVACDVAGVGFSMDPVSGQLDHMVFDANLGLGESVVGGDAEVDHFAVDKASMTIRERRIARKTHMVVATDAGTETRAIPTALADLPCLNDAQLMTLATLLKQVEARAGFPQDIEWGFLGEALYLLQARPITTVPPHWTREESAERFPNVMTPLTWDLVEEGFHRSLNDSFDRMGFPPFAGKWFALHDGYVYGNQNAVKLYARRQVAVPMNLDEVRTAIPALRQRYAWVQDLPVQWARDLDHYLIGIGKLMAEPLGDKSLAEVWRFVCQVRDLGSDYFLPNIAISITQGSLYRLLHHLLVLAVGADAGRTLFDDLMAHCDTKTGIINRELHELAALIQRTPNLKEALWEGSGRELLEQGLLERFPVFAQPFEKFLRDHGHRELDFDPYHPTWIEAPWLALDSIRLIVKSPPETPPRERERHARITMLEAERRLLAALPTDLHFFYMEMIRLTRTYTTLDDLEHYQTTRITLPFRKGLREMGLRLAARGVIPDPMDVFFSRFAELDEAVQKDDAGLWSALSRNIARVKADYLVRRDQSPRWDLQAAAMAPDDDHGVEEGTLRGLPGSPGMVEGAVFIVTGEEGFSQFIPGSVLVARTTNPAWTPLFYAASAVVTESGGPLSHGAVTAREMGIPAVMGVRHLFQHIKNGQRVRVDGVRGSVQLLS